MRRFEYRRLGKFTYHVIESPRSIKRLLLKCIMAEWESDHAQAPEEPWTVEWMQRLPAMRFSLKKARLSDIRPRRDLMQYRTPTCSFADALEERVREREQAVQRGCSIEPLLIDGSSMELMDGYVRYTLLVRHRQALVYAYVGIAGGIQNS